jgi:hypothetical protein
MAGRSISLVNLAMQVRHATHNGRELVELFVRIARGETIEVAGHARGQRPNLDQRMAACFWLADRGWGKAKEIIELTGSAPPPSNTTGVVGRPGRMRVLLSTSRTRQVT